MEKGGGAVAHRPAAPILRARELTQREVTDVRRIDTAYLQSNAELEVIPGKGIDL